MKILSTKPFAILSDNHVLAKLFKITKEDTELLYSPRLKEYVYRQLNEPGLAENFAFDKVTATMFPPTLPPPPTLLAGPGFPTTRDLKLQQQQQPLEEQKIPRIKYEDSSQREEPRFFISPIMGPAVPKLEPGIDDAFPLEYCIVFEFFS